jgi:hypothetical protein
MGFMGRDCSLTAEQAQSRSSLLEAVLDRLGNLTTAASSSQGSGGVAPSDALMAQTAQVLSSVVLSGQTHLSDRAAEATRAAVDGVTAAVGRMGPEVRVPGWRGAALW